MNRTARRELIADMSSAQAACNTALQQLDSLVHKTPYGAGRRRAQSAARRQELAGPGRETIMSVLSGLQAALGAPLGQFGEAIDEYLESLR